MTRLTRVAIGAALSMALVACGKTSGQLPGATYPVGPGGGTIQLTDGAAVQIPPNALTTTVNITMAQVSGQQIFQPNGFLIVGPFYELTPHGQTFAAPVSIVLPYATATVGDKVQAVRIYMTQDGKTWEMATDTGHTQAGFVSGKTTHFSWAVAGLPANVSSGGDPDAGSWADGVTGPDGNVLPGPDALGDDGGTIGPDGGGGQDGGSSPDGQITPDVTGADGGGAGDTSNPELSNGCTVSEKPGCVGCTCIGQVCNELPGCCSESWSQDCADMCAEVGGCGGEKICGDGVCSTGTENCKSCPTDCGQCPATCGDTVCDEGEDCDNCSGDCGECEPFCGDFQCNGEDTCKTCWEDCGNCPPECGDGECNGSETCTSCSEDCGACAPKCGDSQCNGTETCTSCEKDCGKCPATCGDSKCDAPGETCTNCEKDCGKCPATCGDSKCDAPGETCTNCEKDCGKCPPKCGDAHCDAPTETCTTCKADCGECAPTCGDGTCNGTETCTTCSKDCGACPAGKCTGKCGAAATDGTCYCDSQCVTSGDCCADACSTCGYCSGGATCGDGTCNGTETCTTCSKDCGACPTGKCTGYCGNKSPSGCYCDSACVGSGDCCSDACSICGYCK